MSIGPLVNATRAAPADRPLVARGRVVKAPATATDSMSVVLINYSNALDYEVVAGNWEARGTSLPKIGDVCAVVFDDDGDAWVPTWNGADEWPSRGGSGTFVFPGGSSFSDLLTIPHGFGSTPGWAHVGAQNAAGKPSVVATVRSLDATNIVCIAVTIDGSAHAAGDVTGWWAAGR